MRKSFFVNIIREKQSRRHTHDQRKYVCEQSIFQSCRKIQLRFHIVEQLLEILKPDERHTAVRFILFKRKQKGICVYDNIKYNKLQYGKSKKMQYCNNLILLLYCCVLFVTFFIYFPINRKICCMRYPSSLSSNCLEVLGNIPLR